MSFGTPQERASDGHKFKAYGTPSDDEAMALLDDDAPEDDGSVQDDETAAEEFRKAEAKPKKTAAPKAEEPEEEDDEQDTEDDDTTASADAEPEVDDAALDRAYAALLRDGWSRKAIDKLDPAVLLEVGEKRLKNQQDVDRLLRERPKADAAAEATEDPTRADTGAVPGTPSLAELTAAARPIVEALENGEDASEALVGFTQRAVQEAMGPLQKTNERLVAYVDDLVWDAARREAVERVPQLSDSTVDKAVRGRLNSLLQLPNLHSHLEGRERYLAVLEDAIRLEVPDAPSAAEQARQARLARRRANGQVTAPRRSKPKDSKSKTPEEIADAKLEMVFQGKTAEEIRRRYPD